MLRFTVVVSKDALLAELRGLVLEASADNPAARLLPASPNAPDFQVVVTQPRLVWMVLLEQVNTPGIQPLLTLGEAETIDLTTGQPVGPEDAPEDVP